MAEPGTAPAVTAEVLAASRRGSTHSRCRSTKARSAMARGAFGAGRLP